MVNQPNTALLVIDVQESFRRSESWAAISDPHIVEKVSSLVDHARAAGQSVFWIFHEEPGSGSLFDPALGFCRPIDGLDPHAGEGMVRKNSLNAFTTTALAQLLTRAGVSRVRVCGIRTEQCCETTARVAGDMGYNVEFVIDATATHPLPLWDHSGLLSTDEVIARTGAALTERFAAITTVAEVLDQ